LKSVDVRFKSNLSMMRDSCERTLSADVNDR
jgi:hypothetical protein